MKKFLFVIFFIFSLHFGQDRHEFKNLNIEEQQKVLKEQKAEEARWQRRSSRARANYGRVRENNRDRLDHAAWERGRKVAGNVNLRDDGEVKDHGRKGIK